MVKSFQMPENLNINFTFANGKYTINDLLFRAVGLLPGLPVAGLTYTLTGNGLLATGECVLLFAAGWYIGSRKVFNKSIPLLTALYWQKKNSKRSKYLYNYRNIECENETLTEGV